MAEENNNSNQTPQSSTPGSSIARFVLKQLSPALYKVQCILPLDTVNTLFNQTLLVQQYTAQTRGFIRGQVPLSYIQQNYKKNIVDHLKEFLLRYYIINFLYQQTREQKLFIVGEPRLTDVNIELNNDAYFNFEFSLFPPLTLQDWKYFSFKAPKRKNYKDIDRQVELFIKDEEEKKAQYKNNSICTLGDWVNFDITLIDQNNACLLPQQNFWFCLSDEETEHPIRDLFLNKKISERIITRLPELQQYFSNQVDTQYTFCITIVDIVPYAYFCFDQFKHHFKIKNNINKEVQKKLIEVFSYRNDISLRRAIVEEALKLLLNKHSFTVPHYLILRQKKYILDTMQQNPDYYVYRMQKDFDQKVYQLAEKQTKETIFINQLGHNEHLTINNQDVNAYINLLKRKRMKEFLYFDIPSHRQEGLNIPIPTEEIKYACFREKTINHIIYHLTKK